MLRYFRLLTIICSIFQWDARSGEWKKVGEVTGAAGKEGAQRSSGKQVYEGKVGGLDY